METENVEKDVNYGVNYYDNGNKMFEGYLTNGLLTKWYEDGNKEMEVNFKDGVEEGLMKRWYKNGNKLMEVNFKDGKEEGTGIGWYDDGTKKM